MAPVHTNCLYTSNSESGNDSCSDSEGGDSSASGSRSSSPESVNNKTRRSSQGSDHSRSRSASPANSQASGSSHSEAYSQGRSRKDSASSGSPQRPDRSVRSPSGSPIDDEGNAVSPSNHEKVASRSPSPGDNKSGSGSPQREYDEGRSRSESPADERHSNKSRSQSPEVNEGRKSRSQSVGSNASRQSSKGSRSGSAESGNESHHSKERSESPVEQNTESKTRDGSGSPSEKAGSKSPFKKSGSHSSSESGDSSSKQTFRKSVSPTVNDDVNNQDSDKKGYKSPQEREGSFSPQAGRQSRSASPGSDSESNKEPKDISRKRKRAVLSDDSASDVEGKKVDTGGDKDDKDESEKDLVIDAEALFGDASDISSDEEGKKKKSVKKLSDDEAEPSHGAESDTESNKAKSGEEENEMEVEEKDEEDKENVPEEPQPETRIDVQIPKITTDLGKDIHFVKLPNFLSVETRPFDATTYEDEIDEEETLDEEGRARLKLKVENTIRWKEIIKQNGEFDKQSNARFVRWSDGSMSLHLGSEIFDVYKQPLQGDHNHLFIRQGTGLQGQAVFRTKLTFRPHSTESFTHRKMTMSLADRSQKTAGIKILSLVGKDPEAHRGELIKKEEERLRASVRRESKQRRIREKGASRGLSAGYLEPDRYGDADSDDEGISINAIKKQHKNKINNQRDDRSHIYSSDEEGSDIETRRARRLDKAKALKDSDSEGSGERGGGGGGSKSGDRSSSGED